MTFAFSLRLWKSLRTSSRRVRSAKKSAAFAQPFRPRLEVLEDRTLLSTFTVMNLNDSGSGSLRDAVQRADATSGATINFAQGLHGTITLYSGELDITSSMTINGPGANKLTVSGDNASRIFNISGNTTANISGLTIANGAAVSTGEDSLPGGGSVNVTALGGGGILNQAGATLNLKNSVLADNSATASTKTVLEVYGGGLLNEGTATVASCIVCGNQAVGGGNSPSVPYGGSLGGGIDNFGGATLTVTDSDFESNQAIAAAGNTFGFGGAIDNNAGVALSPSTVSVANISRCTFQNNVATGGQGAVGFGGAISNEFATMNITDSALLHNQALGGTGADGVTTEGQSAGGGIVNYAGTLTVTNSTLIGNQSIGGSGGDNTAQGESEGVGSGGGIANEFALPIFYGFSATATVTGCTFIGNQAIGGDSAAGPGGIAQGGGVTSYAGATLDLSDSAFWGNSAQGGSGASGSAGGLGVGGALDVYSVPVETNSPYATVATVSGTTFAFNQALGGTGGADGDGGLGIGGAIGGGQAALFGYPSDSTLNLNNDAIGFNLAQGGKGGSGGNGGNGEGGALGLVAGSATVTDSALTANAAVGGKGGKGGNGGNGWGGGVIVFAGSTATLQDSNVEYNSAVGGHKGQGGSDGQGVGGGTYNLGTLNPVGSTLIKHNQATTSNDNSYG